MNTLNHIWKNWKTTMFSAINAIVIYCLGKEYLDQPTAELISQLLLIIGGVANGVMRKQ